jgi:O-acetyl-ADP-ribose deacetylase (regulator of RNase III)
MSISFQVAPEPEDADVFLADFDALDDMREAIQSALEGSTARISLHTRSASSLTLPGVFQVLVEEYQDAGKEVHVECFVASTNAVDHLRKYLPRSDHSHARFSLDHLTITVMTGDITRVAVDAVVNASNTRLILGGGVSGALRRACGPRLQSAMSRLGSLQTDGIAATPAFGLQTTERILHVPTANGKEQTVATALRNVLDYCRAHGLSSVAIPGLGMGTGGLDAERFAQQCIRALERCAQDPAAHRPLHVVFVLWTDHAYCAVETAFGTVLARDLVT